MISPEILRRYPYFAAAKDEGLRDLAMLCEEESIPGRYRHVPRRGYGR